LGVTYFIAGVILTISVAFIFYRFGWISTVFFIVLSIVPFFFKGYEDIFTFYILPLIAGTLGGYCFKKGLGLDFFITVSSLLFAIAVTADYHILKYVKEYDFIDHSVVETVQLLNENKIKMGQVFDQYNVSEGDKKIFFESIDAYIDILNDRKWVQFAKDMLPFAAFFYSILLTGFSFFLMKKFFMKKFGEEVKALEFFRVNEFIIFILIAGWGVFIMIDKGQYPVITIIALNSGLAASVLYTIQALGIMKFFIMKRKLPVIILPFIIITLSLVPIVFIFVMTMLTGVGILDLWGDFRKLNSGKELNINDRGQ
jgi:hypothetical protein